MSTTNRPAFANTSISELARQAHVSRTTMVRWLRGTPGRKHSHVRDAIARVAGLYGLYEGCLTAPTHEGSES